MKGEALRFLIVFGMFPALPVFSAPPAAPSNVRLNPLVHNEAAQLQWDSNSEADLSYYRLWRASDPVPVFVAIATTSNLQYFDFPLANNVTFYYGLTAVNLAGEESVLSSTVSIWTHPPLPFAPENPRAVAVSSTTIFWQWTDATPPASAFNEEGFRVINATSAASVSGDLASGSTTFLEINLTPGRLYQRIFEAFNLTGTSRAWSASSNPLVISTWTRPNPPSDFSFTFVGSSIGFQWNSNFNSSSVTYELQSSSNGISWIVRLTTTATQCILTGLTEGQFLHYRLRARIEDGQASVYTPVISTAAVHVPPAPITDLSAAAGPLEGKIFLFWHATGDDGLSGSLAPPARFGISWSTNPAHQFSTSTLNQSFTTAAAAGSYNSYMVNFLAPGVTYYFAVFTQDSELNWSGISNIAYAWAQRDITPPAAVEIVGAVLTGPTSAQITWKSPGDDGNTATLNGYFLVGHATSPFVSDWDFDVRAVVTTVPAVSHPGIHVSTVVQGFNAQTGVYFAVRAVDDAGNKSTLFASTAPAQGNAPQTSQEPSPTPIGLGGTVISFILDNIPPPDATFFTATADPVSDAVVELTWNNPVSADLAGWVLLRSTGVPISSAMVSRGAIFTAGLTLSSSTVVLATGTAISGAAVNLKDKNLSVETTYYYAVFVHDAARDPQTKALRPNYSAGVFDAEQARDHLAPAQPFNVRVEVQNSAAVHVTWQAPVHNADGTLFLSTSTPRPRELEFFQLQRSTSLAGPWHVEALLSVPATSYLSVSSSAAFWRVAAFDTFGNRSKDSMTVSSSGLFYAVAADGISHVRLSRAGGEYLSASKNPFGKNFIVRAEGRPQEQGGTVYTAVRFWIEEAGTGQTPAYFEFPSPMAHVALHYKINAAGQVIFNGAMAQGSAPQVKTDPVRAEQADKALALYWNDGTRRVKIHGGVDRKNQIVETETAYLGTFYVQKVLREQGFDFDTKNISARVFTPNGDGLNDLVIFRFDNPKDAQVEGKVFDLAGGYVADLSAGPDTDSLQWDGRDAYGDYVPAGIYVYQLRAEGKAYNGTVTVAR